MFNIFPSEYFFDTDTEANFIEWILEKTRKFIIAIGILALIYVAYITVADMSNVGKEYFFKSSFYIKLLCAIFLIIFIVIAFVKTKAKLAYKIFLFICVALILLSRVDTYSISSKIGHFTTEAQMLDVFIFMIIPFIKIQHKILIGFISVTGLFINGEILGINYLSTLFYVIIIYIGLCVVYYKFDLLLRIQFKTILEEKLKSNIDYLTGVYNRNALEPLFNEDLSKVHTNEHMIVGILDLDYFKEYNDSYGHLDGDIVLNQFAKALQTFGFDRIYRFGGEEFLFTKINIDDSVALTKICENLENLKIKHAKSSISEYVTASVGIIKVNHSEIASASMNEMIKSADTNLYLAKNNGRNKCVITDYNSKL